MKGKLRHVGKKVDSIAQELPYYLKSGWELIGREQFQIAKLRHGDKVFELVEGRYILGKDEHFAVDWFEDEKGNLVEVVDERKNRS